MPHVGLRGDQVKTQPATSRVYHKDLTTEVGGGSPSLPLRVLYRVSLELVTINFTLQKEAI
jgi:hypothetical protein